MSSKIPVSVERYIDLVLGEKVRTCNEQKLLVNLVMRAFETEDLRYSETQINKYLSYQKYFPFGLFDWEVFCFILHNCIFRPNGAPRWDELLIFTGRGCGKNGYLAFEDFSLTTDTNGVAYYDIDICANSEDQAKTSFDEIIEVLENPKYRKLMLRQTIMTHSARRSRLNFLSYTMKFR